MPALTSDCFYWVKDDALSPEFCQSLIDRFESCPDIAEGTTLNGYSHLKRSTDLCVSGREDFKEEDQTLYLSLTLNMREYLSQLKYRPWRHGLRDSGYNVQRTKPGEGFDWHNDFYATTTQNELRVLTFIWYLNDVDEGGETEFVNGVVITPRVGRLAVFPAEFTAAHRGVTPVSGTKWIATGWFHQSITPS